MAKRILASLVIFCMSFEQCFAQVASSVSLPAAFSAVSAQERFRPPQLRSMVYDGSRKSLDLLLDQGDARNIDVKQATGALMEYFQTALALPDTTFWVNLRPDSQDRIIDPALEKTAFGKALLEADVTLKKDLARATSPLTAEGRKYWTKLYAKAETIFGAGAVNIPTISRPWIVPGEIIIRQDAQSVYVYKAALKVQLEQDYLKNSSEYNFSDPRLKELNEYAGGLIRELILPALTKRVNSARGYASLRQAYYSLILAQWYKKHFRGTQAEYAGRIDSQDLTGLNSGTWSKEEYFNAYRASFSGGEYNVNENIATSNGTTVRRYASGGAVLGLNQATIINVAPGSRLMNQALPAGTQLLDGGTLTPRDGDDTPAIDEQKGAPLARGALGVNGAVSGRVFVYDEGKIVEANAQALKQLKKETRQPVILYTSTLDESYMPVLDLADGLIAQDARGSDFTIKFAQAIKIPAVAGTGRIFIDDRGVRTGDAVVIDGIARMVYADKSVADAGAKRDGGTFTVTTRKIDQAAVAERGIKPLAKGIGTNGAVSGRLFVYDQNQIVERNEQAVKQLKKEARQPVILYVAEADPSLMKILDGVDGIIVEKGGLASFAMRFSTVREIPVVVGIGKLFVDERAARSGDAIVVDGTTGRIYAEDTRDPLPIVAFNSVVGHVSSVTRRDGGRYEQFFSDATDGKSANRAQAYARLKEVALGKNGRQALKELVAMFESQVPEAVTQIPEDLFGKGFGYDVRGNSMPVPGGIVDLTPMNAYLIGKALGTRYAREGETGLVTGDQRWHTPALRLALALGLYSVGVRAEISDEIFGTGEHGLLSGENTRRYKMMVQVSGSHNVPEKNGLKIKADTGDGKLEPVYAADLSDLYDKIIKTNSFRAFNPAYPVTESQPLIDIVVDAYDKTLPAVNPEQPVVFDCRNSALVDALKKLVAKRGLKNVRWLNDVADPSMPGGIWDPAKPEALVPGSNAVKEWNAQLAAQKSPLRAVGFVFDGDGDRATGILEDGQAVPAFEMTLPFYQRFISDPVNQRVVKRLREFGEQEIQLACDIRATSTLLKMIDRYPDYAGYYIQPGYPAQRDFVSWRIRELKERVNMNSKLRLDPQFMEDFHHFCETYFTAEASGHQFFHICPTNKEVVIDAGIAVAFNLLHIKETIGQVEVNDPALGFPRGERSAEKYLGPVARLAGRPSVYKYSLADLFAKFPKAIASDDVGISVPNVIKAELEQVMVRKLQERYAGQLADSSPLSIVGKMRIQPKEVGTVLTEGVKVQFKDGKSSALFRKSNTSEKATLMFEGATPQKLAELMTDMEGVIKDALKEFAQSGDQKNADAAAKVDLKDLAVKTQAVKAKYNLDGGFTPAQASADIDFILRALNIKDYPRVIETLRRSTDPVAFVDTLVKVSGTDTARVIDALASVAYFAPIAANYRVRTAASFAKAEFALKTATVAVKARGYDLEGAQADNAGEPISDYLKVMRRAVGNVPFVFRDNMLDFVGKFLGRRSVPADPDLEGLIRRTEHFFSTVDTKNLRYVVTSGIGANEMYSHELAQILNASFKARGIDVTWIVVNNPAHLNRLPADAVDANTIVFEMSRSGTTKETLDFFNATKDMFRTRIVAANSGPLKEGALALRNSGGNTLVIDDTPGDIGGRQMNRKTLMVYLPLFVALTAGLKDTAEARKMLGRYVSASLVANAELSYSDPASAAVQLAEFLFRHRADGRNKFSVVFDEKLRFTAKELFQLLNEGANKTIAGGSNNNILDSYSLTGDKARYETVFEQAAYSQVPIFLVTKDSDMAYVNELKQKGIPVIVVTVDLGEDLGANLESLARTSALLQDMVVYFTYITNQDANSNPAVKLVREITKVMFKNKQKLASDDIRMNAAEVLGAMSVQQKADLEKAKAALAAKNIARAPAGAQFAQFEQALADLARLLGVSADTVVETLFGAISPKVFTADVLEAGGSSNADGTAAFDESEMIKKGLLGKFTTDRALTPLEQQVILRDEREYRVSVLMPAGSQVSFAGSLSEKLGQYFHQMYLVKEKKAEFQQMALSYMEADADNPAIKEIAEGLTELFAGFNVTIPKLALPGVAHTGIEAIMSHPENVFNIAIVSTETYGEGLGTREVEPGVKVDPTTYAYFAGNIYRGSKAGIPTIIFELKNKDQLPRAREDILSGMASFRDRISGEEDGGMKTAVPAETDLTIKSILDRVESLVVTRFVEKDYNRISSTETVNQELRKLELYLGSPAFRQELGWTRANVAVYYMATAAEDAFKMRVSISKEDQGITEFLGLVDFDLVRNDSKWEYSTRVLANSAAATTIPVGASEAIVEAVKGARKDGGLGGIALGVLPIMDMTRVPVAQVVAGSALTLSQLDSQWRTIRLDMTTGGVPFLKIKEYLSACAGRKDAAKQLRNVTTCVSNILKKDEEEATATSPELKELLGLLG